MSDTDSQSPADSQVEDIANLVAWRASINSLKVDIVGDFAGKELFAVHGESLVAHCTSQANVDYQDGFQLLHAVYAVETFLSKLKERGCNFHVLWFDGHKSLTVPQGVLPQNEHKYYLTRAVLIEHLRSHQAGPDAASEDGVEDAASQMSFCFPALDSEEFRAYTKQNALHFVMCLDGVASGQEEYTALLYLLAQARYNLAFMNTIEFRSSKAYASVTTPSGSMDDIEAEEPESEPERDFGCLEIYEKLGEIQGPTEELSRADVAVVVCSAILSNTKDRTHYPRFVTALLVHLTLLEHTDITQRSYAIGNKADETLDGFLMKFSVVAARLLGQWPSSQEGRSVGAVFDLIDGRLFLQVLSSLESLQLPAESSILDIVETRVKLVSSLTGVQLPPIPKASGGGKHSGSKAPAQTAGRSTVLPFSHPVMDKHLQEVKLAIDPASEPDSNRSKIFQELTHWHNAKKPIDPKRSIIKKPLDFRAARRNQWFMRDTIAYSASLTNASGKNIEPEIIVVERGVPQKKAAETTSNAAQAGKKQPKQAQPNKPVKGGKQAPKGGKQAALETAMARQAEKQGVKSQAAVTSWEGRCREFQKERSPLTRFLKVRKYLASLSRPDMDAVGGEVLLYACDALGSIRGSMKNPGDTTGLSTLALLWSAVQDMQHLKLTTETQAHLEKLAQAVRLPLSLGTEVPRPLIHAGHRLPFNTEISKPATHPKLPVNPLGFQLEHCGPYLERSFNSADDPRVPFQPDEWQRKVLDSIDADNSLFVVAPTSAGKTFISFYAMKKVLQANDDDVVVYVAPTKALVNQVAAEIQARFTKSYGHQDGKSVWAIHTRDYRINNPSGCQVLVTVPAILQIMLLAPSNAQKANSWSHRVKRIIFDEVHCIGQAEDGIIWEQLLLLSPCPIIALSATVGNPVEFYEWLASTQQRKGFKMDMVVHTARYSELRKYFYLPPATAEFKPHAPVEVLPIPGLDTHNGDVERFAFVNPIGGISNTHRETLTDVSLESRDCLQLWAAMCKHATASHPVNPALAPEKQLPSLLKKSDVLGWEKKLKDHLHKWMVDPDSPFPLVQKELQPKLPSELGDPKNKSMLTSRAKPETRDPSILSLLSDLRTQGALPVLIFNYDRVGCESAMLSVLELLQEAEQKYRDTSKEWAKKMVAYEDWKKSKTKMKKVVGKVGKSKDQDASATTKADLAREEANQEANPWASFDPEAPLPEFSFANTTKISKEELEQRIHSLRYSHIPQHFVDALRRGVGVHHAGMNRQYRQVVEMLFRKGFLTAVVATGTLALGINMPCKTVAFLGDSVFLTSLNYRQASGRAGRRGFDVLGNVVFHNIKPNRAMEIMSSRLPDLKGQFPSSVTLMLRLFGLLHGTNNSEFAIKAVESLLTQTRLFLGGPSSQLTVKHHLRFSIEYLRRQQLLSAEGVPLNFAGMVGHLYFTENSVFAFHSLLKSGYLHELCAKINQQPKEVLQSLVLVLCHLFSRISCPRYKDQKWVDTVVHKSPSLVMLPALPEKAERILRGHNQETLEIFESYVRTYVEQHLLETPDNKLPFTNHTVAPKEPIDLDGTGITAAPKTTSRSPFAALSGLGDEFKSVQDLCETVRAGVFLEEAAVPYIPIYPDDTNGVPFNAYIYDFFKHGDMTALVRDNGIKGGDVWFLLKDFSLVLATITASLENILRPDSDGDDAAMVDIQDAGDIIEEGSGEVDDDIKEESLPGKMNGLKVEDKTAAVKPKGKKKKVVDDWMDAEISDDATPESDGEESDWETNSATGATGKVGVGSEQSLTNVHKAFKLLREEYDEKFRKVWS
ncbi:uncharacterized protein BCR38DRAFT_433323 [Pseudomassariella vexata]|uniref:P-loop containing nucleoside triphosphate hydrolase protein n=1 Tax=Pseudomassariella vexata TaxID=1141098 RepID=A0A1Y2DYZ9_9PEZI|nr:uncharacterized protein BCR38DRAFT_433323 [Pseudomassariella vexata]ORY63865.1 hypothetical protein BCR38DRAFT_433323 [Pseudomassariella vexata]